MQIYENYCDVVAYKSQNIGHYSKNFNRYLLIQTF